MLRCEVTDVYDHLVFFDLERVRRSGQPDTPLEEDESEKLYEAFRQAFRDCHDQGVLDADSRMLFAMAISRLHRREYTSLSLTMVLDDLRWKLITRLNAIKFALIREESVGYFEQEELFGSEVHKAFPEARADIKDAGNCIAADLCTAAVYQLMRVAELGLRRLARKLKVKLKDRRGPQPITFADWEKIIAGCKTCIDAARAMKPTGPKRQAALERYCDIADHCLFMKDIWRNSAAHVRKPYSRSEAIAAFERVRDFMRSAVSVLGEAQ
jgi:hypothetical protein